MQNNETTVNAHLENGEITNQDGNENTSQGGDRKPSASTPETVPYFVLKQKVDEKNEYKKRYEELLQKTQNVGGQQADLTTGSVVKNNAPPNRDNYDGDEDRYIEDLIEYKATQKASEIVDAKLADRETKAKNSNVEEKISTYDASLGRYASKNPGILDAQKKAQGIQFSKTISDQLILLEGTDSAGNDIRARLTHELLANPAELVQLNSADPLTVARALGRMEHKVANGKVPKVTGAPEVMPDLVTGENTVSGTNGVALDSLSGSAFLEEYNRSVYGITSR